MYTDYNDENKDNSYSESTGPDKEKLKKIILIVLGFVALVVLIVVIAKGCSNSKSKPISMNNQEITTSIIVNHQSLALEVNDSFQLHADVLTKNNPNPVVSWISEDSSIAVVNDEGYVTGLSEGTTNILATYYENKQVYTSKCSVVVTTETVEIQSIDIVQDDLTLVEGGSTLLQVDINPKDAKLEGGLVYESKDPSVATISDSGFVNAISEGVTTITVKTEDEKFSDSVMVVVKKSGSTIINPTSVKLLGLTNGLKVGSETRVLYNVSPDNATDKSLTWTSSDPSVAIVNEYGVVRGIKAGTCTIMASTSNNISGTIEVVVEANTVSVSGITIDGDNSITMQTGGTRMLFYTITPSNATNKKVIYMTNNPNVVTVNSSGILTAVGVGNAIIVITTEDGAHKAYLNVSVQGDTSSESGSSGSEGSGSSGSSGSGSSGSSGSGESGGSGNNQDTPATDSTCNAYDMIIITHDYSGKGPTISNNSYDIAVPFPSGAKPKVTVTQYADCIKTALYYIDYGRTKDTITKATIATGTLSKSGQSFYLNKGDGYYRIRIKATTKDGKTLTKDNYYAVVGAKTDLASDTTKPNISISYKTASSTTKTVTMTAKDSGAGVAKIMYCDVNSQSRSVTCTPTTTKTYDSNLNTATFNKDYNIARVNAGYYKIVCAKAIDASGNESARVCSSIYSNSPDLTKPVINSLKAGLVRETNKIQITTVVNETGSGLQNIKYCATSSTTCTPNITLESSTTNFPVGSSLSYTKEVTYITGYTTVCTQATDFNNNKSDKKCTTILGH